MPLHPIGFSSSFGVGACQTRLCKGQIDRRRGLTDARDYIGTCLGCRRGADDTNLTLSRITLLCRFVDEI